jgi:hypothetical protein
VGYPGLRSLSPPLYSCSLALEVRTGNRRLDTALVPCRCPSKSFRVPSPKFLLYALLMSSHHRSSHAFQPTAESHLPPAQTLQAAREQLLSIFLRQFEQASRSRDAAATSRYFKLFPAIGWEAEGLEAYASFVIDLVRVRIPTSAKSRAPY